MDVTPTPAGTAGRVQSPVFRRRIRGLSLMDLITGVAIASLLLGIGIPGFQRYLASSRLVTSTNLMARSLALARSEAVRRRQVVVICKSRDRQTCSREGSWRQGWILFADAQPDRLRGENEPLLAARGPLPAGIQLDYRAFRSSNFITFYPTGISLANGTFTLCHQGDAASARALILSKTGRVRLSRRRANGQPLDCPG